MSKESAADHFDAAPPAEAFRFLASGQIEVAEAGSDNRKFEGVAISGEVITNHGYWSRAAFDLSTMRFAERIPALVDHDTRQRAGWAELSVADGKLTARGQLMKNQHGSAVAEDSLAGFPWQMSVGIGGARIEELTAGAKSSVNGRDIEGPAVIFRDAQVIEVSFVPNGADDKTSARVFSRGNSAANQEGNTMTDADKGAARIAELEAQVAAITAERDAAQSELATVFKAKRTEEVKALFAATGREFSEASAAVYLALSDEQFAAVSSDLRAAIKPADRVDLETEQATAGKDAGQQFSAREIAARAQQFQAEAADAGRPISTLQALRMAREALTAN